VPLALEEEPQEVSETLLVVGDQNRRQGYGHRPIVGSPGFPVNSGGLATGECRTLLRSQRVHPRTVRDSEEEMAKAEAFVLPAGIVLSVEPDGLSIEHAGDLVLNTDLGRTLKRISSTAGNVTINIDCNAGDVLAPKGTVVANGKLTARRIAAASIVLKGPTTAEDLEASGSIDIDGKQLDVTNVRGGDVAIAAKLVKAKVVHGTSSVTVGPIKITADILMAPEVQVDPKCSGKVTVIEARNEVGQHGIKGGLSIDDLQEMFGNAAQFLSERGLAPLSGHAPPASTAEVEDDEEAEVEVEPSDNGVGDAADAVDEALVEDETNDEIDLDEPAPPPVVATPAPAGVDPAIHQEIVDTVARIEACYADTELPPAVLRLQGLVADRDYQAIRTSITEIWNELIKFHQQRGMRIQPQVTTTFNTINSIVRRA
jgi:hypothetical protein